MIGPDGSRKATTAPSPASPISVHDVGPLVREQKASARGRSTVIQAAGSVINGDIFVGRFARLRDKWLDPVPVFEEVQVERFVGREWLLEPLHRFLAGNDRGYFIVQADAGLGKTAFAAWLAWSHDWPSHFTRRRRGRMASTALSNLAAQLIARYQLDEEFAPRGILPETAGEPGWFEQVLRAAASKALAAGQQVVIVVDGLDEAEEVEGDLPLGLPAVLPRGSFIVATCRTGTNLPALRRPWKPISIEPRDRHNTGDIERFLRAAFTEDQDLASLLSDAGVTAEAITARALDRCGGVWVYLRYVLDELRLGLRLVQEIDELPADLAGYYTESLMPDQDELDWGQLRLPLLATLAAAAEPLPVETLTRLAGLPDPHPVYVLCRTRLRPFLTATADETGEQRYSVYHASLREFLAGNTPVTFIHGDQAQREELARAATNAHARIADYYLTVFGGLHEQFPLLAVHPSIALEDDGYALRHLARHLERAGRHGDLDALLACEHSTAGAYRNVWYTAHDHASTLHDYRADVDRARRQAALRTDQDVACGRTAPSISLELRYVIIDSVIRTLTSNVPSELIARLIDCRWWSPARGLFYARQSSDLGQRAATLATLVSHLPEHDRPAVAREAIDAASQIGGSYDRAWAFSVLLEELPGPHPDQLAIDALAATAEATEDDDKVQLLAWLTPYLPALFLPDAVAIAGAITDETLRTHALTDLIEHLPDTDVPDSVWPAILAMVSAITDGGNQSLVIAALTRRAPVDMVAILTAAARAIPSDDDRAWALGIVTARAPEMRRQLIVEALESARSAEDPAYRAWALSSLADHLSADERGQVLDEALAAARAAHENRTWALVVVASELPPARGNGILTEVLTAALAMPSESERADRLAMLAPFLTKRLTAKAVSASFAIQAEPERAEVLAAYAPYMSERLLEQALTIAVEIGDETQRGIALRALAPELPDRLVADALAAATSLSSAGQKNLFITEIIDKLPDRLLGEALNLVQAMTNEGGGGRFLGQMAARVQASQRARLLTEALHAARSVTDRMIRAQALGDLAANLSGPERAGVFDEAIQAAKSDPDEYGRVYALDYLIPKLPAARRPEVISDALANTRVISALTHRAFWLAELARHVPRSQRQSLFTEAVQTAREIPSERLRLSAFAQFAGSFPADQRTAIIREIRALASSAFKDAPLAVRIFTKLTQLLPERMIAKLFGIIRQAMCEDRQLTAAGEFLKHVPKPLINESLEGIRSNPQGLHYAHALGAVALYVPPPLDQKAIDLALAANQGVVARRAIMAQARSLWGEKLTTAELKVFRQAITDIVLDDCLSVLASALDIISQIGGTEALDDCLETFRAIQRWWPPPHASTGFAVPSGNLLICRSARVCVAGRQPRASRGAATVRRLDRPEFLGGCDLWESWDSCNHGSSTPLSCGNVRWRWSSSCVPRRAARVARWQASARSWASTPRLSATGSRKRKLTAGSGPALRARTRSASRNSSARIASCGGRTRS